MKNVRASFVRLVSIAYQESKKNTCAGTLYLPIASGYIYIWDAWDHFYSNESIRLEVLIFNNDNLYVYIYTYICT